MSTSSEGRPGKYQRSAAGLVAALLVTVVGIGALIWLLGLFRPDVEVEPGEVDHVEVAADAQDAGLRPVYPEALPEGWSATRYEYSLDEDGGAVYDLLMFDDEEEFVGVRQATRPAAELVRELVDEEATPTDIYSVDGSVAEAWQGYEDEDGDTAYAAEVGKETVLVYGPASPEELQDLIGRLTTEPAGDVSR